MQMGQRSPMQTVSRADEKLIFCRQLFFSTSEAIFQRMIHLVNFFPRA
jgi:hypothetical protein